MEPVTVMFLHALPLDGRMWDDVRARIELPTLAPTLYALGDSIGQWAEAVLDLAGHGPLVLVGCSVGGTCALEVARAAPDRVEAIVLVGAKAGVRADPTARDEAIRTLQVDGVHTAWDTYWKPRFGRQTAAAVIERARTQATEQSPIALARGVRAFHDRADLTDFAARWTKPLAVISGDQDRTPSPATARRIADGPLRTFHLVADSGHYVPLEQPGAFGSILRELAAITDAATPG
ncbi:MAG: alpha/beta hydrolase [Acidimicrobiia bacterium]